MGIGLERCTDGTKSGVTERARAVRAETARGLPIGLVSAKLGPGAAGGVRTVGMSDAELAGLESGG